jgi:hypothetical protein
MPDFVIVACFAVATAMVLFNYIQRFRGLRAETYQIHPCTIFIWLLNSLLTAIFLLASQNWILAAQTFFILALQLALIIWGVINLKKSRTKLWKIAWTDYLCLALAIVATATYILTDNALAGAVIVFIGSVIGEIPTLRKIFIAPQTDRPQFYLVAGLRYIVLTGTLQKIDLVGLFSSLFWGIFELICMTWVIFCQKRVRIMKEAR